MNEIVDEKNEKKNEKNDKYKEYDEEEEDEEDDEEEEEEEEQEEQETEEEKKLKRILQKYGIENDEEMPIIIEKIMNEIDLSQEDYDFLYDLYLKSLVKY